LTAEIVEQTRTVIIKCEKCKKQLGRHTLDDVNFKVYQSIKTYANDSMELGGIRVGDIILREDELLVCKEITSTNNRMITLAINVELDYNKEQRSERSKRLLA